MKKILVLILFALSVLSFGQSRYPYSNSAHLGSSGTVYTDNFDALVTGNLGGQGDWLAGSGSFNNKIYDNGGGDMEVNGEATGTSNYSIYNKTLNNNQYSQIVVTAVPGTGVSDYVGVCVRLSDPGSSNIDGYFYRISSNGSGRLGRVDNYVNTYLGNFGTATIHVGDTIRLEINGTTLSCYINGSLDTTVATNGEYTDATYSSGQAGVLTYDGTTSTRFDDFECGDL